MPLENYLSLGESFYQSSQPKTFEHPELLLFNQDKADTLDLDSCDRDRSALTSLLSGQNLQERWVPAALAYSGHQFGHFNPSLGDGRAHYLGEFRDQNGKPWELQLKGSGRTPFSRGGDGLCGLGPAVREFIMSAAMAGLDVPTTHSLSVVKTGERILRDGVVEGAVVSRLASSHIRVGTFQYFAARGLTEELQKLSLYSMQRHFPELYSEVADSQAPELYGELLKAVIDKQITLITHWMRVGFIHGVMNTDNTLISGDTIDFGPCAMLGAYDPNTVYSSIDHHGRYAFGKQPDIALWNLTRFAECLIPLIDADDPEKAVSILEPILKGFRERFSSEYMSTMRQKIGLTENPELGDRFVGLWLNLLKEHALDYTQSFNLLTMCLAEGKNSPHVPEVLTSFVETWLEQIDAHTLSRSAIFDSMKRHNPFIIPRNHLVEKAIQECEAGNGTALTTALIGALRQPYERNDSNSAFDELPEDGDRSYVTYCGT